MLDLRLEVGECDATVTDRVEDTVDYAEVCQIVALVAQQRSYRTLERLCAAIADRLLDEYDADAVWVKAAKPEPPIAAAGRGGLGRGVPRRDRVKANPPHISSSLSTVAQLRSVATPSFVPASDRASLGFLHPVRVPGVDLLLADDDVLGRHGQRRDLLGSGPGLERLGQEQDVLELGDVGDGAQRVVLHHGGDLVAGADDHGHVEAELALDQRAEPLRRLCGRRVGVEDDVAALHVGLDAGVAGRGEGLPERGHRQGACACPR